MSKFTDQLKKFKRDIGTVDNMSFELGWLACIDAIKELALEKQNVTYKPDERIILLSTLDKLLTDDNDCNEF